MPTILIADDHDMNRMVLGKLLEREGYTIVEAADGASAIEQVRNERPDIALVDLLMPVVDGFEFVHRLREEGGDLARTPVVFITAAYLPEEVTSLSKSCGVSHVISRPAPFEDILSAIQEAMTEEPPPGIAPPRREFRLELLRLLTSTLSQKVRTVIPSMARFIEESAKAPASEEPKAPESGGPEVSNPHDPCA